MAHRTARYQGAIVRDGCLLLIKHRHSGAAHSGAAGISRINWILTLPA
jgi:hypothetical protein